MKYKGYKCDICTMDEFDLKPLKETVEEEITTGNNVRKITRDVDTVQVVCKKCGATLTSMNRADRRDLKKKLLSYEKRQRSLMLEKLRKENV